MSLPRLQDERDGGVEPPSPPDGGSTRSTGTDRGRIGLLAVAIVVLGAGIGFWRLAPVSRERPDVSEMNAGLALEASDPAGAAMHFRKVLLLNPDHYGANFQLARSLDLAGNAGEARPVWEHVVQLAQAIDDRPILDVARAQLARSAPTEDEQMKMGLDALYSRHDPAGAAVVFRQILARNPQHYGATFQLARTLDLAGNPTESRPLWDKMIKWAEASGDAATLEEARKRLAEIDEARKRLGTRP
jgi:tetratricopeptide (TPR) repeat protein